MNEENAYRQAIREFEAVVEHLRAISNTLSGKMPANLRQGHCEQILVKLLTHCLSLRKLMPDPNGRIPNELWDLPSISAIARCVIEAHDAFLYLGDSRASEEEWTFRLAFWQLHDQDRRLKMLDSIGSQDPRVSEIQSNGAALREKVLQSPFFQRLPRDFQSKVRAKNAPYMVFTPRSMCDYFGINYDYYNVATMELSQHVHTFPFSVHQLMGFRAGTEDATRLMKLPIQYALGFLSRVAVDAKDVFNCPMPEPASRTRWVMLKWLGVYSRGIKSIQVGSNAIQNTVE